MRYLPFLIALTVCLLLCDASKAGNPTPQQKAPPKASDGTVRLTPTLVPGTKSEIRVPEDLEDALKELRHTLPPTLVADMKRGTEDDMWQYHMSIGLWIRNNWGFWKGSRLSKWFNRQGIGHPDDMSGIILTSFWRSINQKPVELDAQIKVYQDYWIKAKQDNEKEKKRVAEVKGLIPQRMLGWKIPAGAGAAPTLPLPPRMPFGLGFGLAIRYASPFFAGGGLITAKQSVQGKSDGSLKLDDFITTPYVVDIAHKQLRPVQIPEIARIENTIVAFGGTVAFFHGSAKSGAKNAKRSDDVLLEIRASGARRRLPNPPGTGVLRLGHGENNDLLAVRPHAVYRWPAGAKTSAQQWELLYLANGKDALPHCAVPPQLYQKRIYFRDEGLLNEQLSWLDITPSANPPHLVYFDEDNGMVGVEGPRWENVWSYGFVKEKSAKNNDRDTLWIATGMTIAQQSLLRWTNDGGYRIALFNGATRFGGDFFENGDAWKNFDPKLVAITGLEARSSGGRLHAVGPHGFYTLNANGIRRLTQFTNAEDWIPTHIVALRPHLYLLGGHYGGVYLFHPPTPSKSSAKFIPFAEHLGPPVRL